MQKVPWKFVAFGSCVAGIVLWTLLALYSQGGENRPWKTALFMMAILAIGAVASLTAAVPVMYAVFAVAFVPCGLYLLGAEGWGVLIGVSNLVLLAATIQMHRMKRLQSP